MIIKSFGDYVAIIEWNDGTSDQLEGTYDDCMFYAHNEVFGPQLVVAYVQEKATGRNVSERRGEG